MELISLLVCYGRMTNWLDMGIAVDVLYFDSGKDFWQCLHNILVDKLMKYRRDK